MNKVRNKKYFGEMPLEGPTDLGALYKNRHKNNTHSKPDNNFRRENRNQRHYPSPEELIQYDKVCVGASDKILALLEIDQQHRHKHDVAKVKSQITSRRMEAAFAFVFSLAVLAATVFFTSAGHTHIALATVFCGLVTVIVMIKRISYRQHHHRQHHYKRPTHHKNHRSR
jgi:uncharacterized membrane protein